MGAITLIVAATMARLGIRLARSSSIEARGALREVLLLGGKAVVWGPGFLAVVASTLHAWKRDRDQGIEALAQAGGFGARSWMAARAAVLAAWLVALCAASTAVVVLAVVGANPSAAPMIGAGLVPTGVFALTASIVLSLLASACLGPRSRPGGYALLAVVLFLPELLAPWTESLLGRDGTSIPALLSGLAHAARPASFDAGRAATCATLWLVLVTLLVGWCERAAASWSRSGVRR